ncbi:MAG: hypothetical protein JW832_05520, partial [Deltaproteobacteria bacterium]|nr:hypothetical protein [Deltaproteobacteria bacterium]
MTQKSAAELQGQFFYTLICALICSWGLTSYLIFIYYPIKIVDCQGLTLIPARRAERFRNCKRATRSDFSAGTLRPVALP